MGEVVDTRLIETEETTYWLCDEFGWECYEQDDFDVWDNEREDANRAEVRTAKMQEYQIRIREFDEEGEVESAYWVTKSAEHIGTERKEKSTGSDNKVVKTAA